jgi:hypothetical protein
MQVSKQVAAKETSVEKSSLHCTAARTITPVTLILEPLALFNSVLPADRRSLA